jgi:hypothetical protein
MMSMHAEVVKQPLAELLREITQAHFLCALAAPEALVVLRERRERIGGLLLLCSEQEPHPGAALLLEHVQLVGAAELAWIEQAITVLQDSGCPPEAWGENVGGAERAGA